MELEDLALFRAVVRCGSVTQAALALGMTQSTASRHLKRLEDAVGDLLIDRSEWPLRPTESGRRLLAFAEETLARWASLRQDLTSVEELGGALRVAASSAPALGPVSMWLAEFVRRHPAVRPQLRTMASHAVEEAVLRHRVALGFMGCPPINCCLDAEPVATDRIRLLLPRALADVLPVPVPPTRLVDLPWVVRDDGSGTWETVREALARRALTVAGEPAMVVDSAEAAIAAVRSGLGATFVAGSAAARLRDPDVVVTDVAGLDLQRSIYLVSEPEALWRNPVASQFRRWVLALGRMMPALA